jgi:6-phosphogluconolactonase
MSAAQREILGDSRSLARRAVEFILEQAQASIAASGRFRIALSGGSTPRTSYELLATEEYARQIPWDKVHVFWGDERCVPPDDPQSDYRMANEALLKHLPLPPENVHRMEAELEPETAAARYTAVLEKEFGPDKLPEFDLILLGLGEDGHTASLFPGSSALAMHDRWVAAHYVEQLAAWRLTLTYPVINAARQVVFLVSGGAKASVVAEILEQGNLDHPAARVSPGEGKLFWLLDADAAVGLMGK